MNLTAWQHLFSWRNAFDYSVTVWIVAGVSLALLIAPLCLLVLFQFKLIPVAQRPELFRRWRSWLWLSAAMVGPVLLGAGWVMFAVAALSWLCFHEFARATGLFREYSIMTVVIIGIFALLFANLDHFDRMFFSLAALVCGG